MHFLLLTMLLFIKLFLYEEGMVSLVVEYLLWMWNLCICQEPDNFDLLKNLGLVSPWLLMNWATVEPRNWGFKSLRMPWNCRPVPAVQGKCLMLLSCSFNVIFQLIILFMWKSIGCYVCSLSVCVCVSYQIRILAKPVLSVWNFQWIWHLNK